MFKTRCGDDDIKSLADERQFGIDLATTSAPFFGRRIDPDARQPRRRKLIRIAPSLRFHGRFTGIEAAIIEARQKQKRFAERASAKTNAASA